MYNLSEERARALGIPVSPALTEIRKKQEKILIEARAALNKIDDDMPPAQARHLEERHDKLMAQYDELEQKAGLETDVAIREAQISRRPISNDGVVVRGQDGGEPEFAVVEPTEAFALRSNQSFTSHVLEKRGSDAPFGALSTGAYLRAMITGPKTAEEKRALSEGTDSAGGFTVPDILSARMIDRMRAASVVFRAGAQTVPLSSDVSYVAKVASDPVPQWRNEAAAIAESDPTFARVTFTARSLGVLVKVSRELLEDSLNMETVLPNLLATALAQELDRVALLGSGTAPEPRGVSNFAGLTASGVAPADLTGYAPLIKARTALRTANSDATAYIMSPRDEGQLAGLTATDGQPINVPPAIARVPMLTTSKLPTNLGSGTDESIMLAGDWSRLMVGVRTDITIGILKERYADTWQYGFVAVMRADIAAEQEAAFTKVTGITLP